MTTRRFEITRVPDPIHDGLPREPPEIIPLIHIENEIPPPPPIPSSLVSTNGKNVNRISSKLFTTFLRRKSLDTRRRATVAAAVASLDNEVKKSASADLLHQVQSTSIPRKSTTQTNFTVGSETEEHDVYATTQSNNNYDSNPLRITNKFLQELRFKRRELLDKAKNVSIDQRIAFQRQQNVRRMLRAQDIFDVHFELTDDDAPLPEANLFTEDSQEKIRNDIYNELNRQRMKQYHKHHRHLLLGRSLLMFMTSLIAFMGFTLIYVVIDIFNRANHLDAKLPESEFIPMIFDKTSNFH
jgi:hypothetical protein